MTQENSFFTIHDFMVTELNLSKTELLVYALIYSYTNNGKYECYCGSLETISKRINATVRSVSNALKSLCEKNLIEKNYPKSQKLGAECNYKTIGLEKISNRLEKISNHMEKISNNNKEDNKEDNKELNIKGTKNCSSHIDEETYYNSLRYMLSNICNELGYIDIKDDVISNVIYFWDMYYTYTMEMHPCYTYELMTKCVRELVENSTDLIGEYSKENIEKAINEFFIQEINYCDYHFAVFVNNNMIKLKLMESNRELHDYDVWREVVNG